MPRVLRRSRDRITTIPAALLAYWARHAARLRRRIAIADDPNGAAEDRRLRLEQIADDEAIAAQGLDWNSRRQRGGA
jgi:hypothetical protein